MRLFIVAILFALLHDFVYVVTNVSAGSAADARNDELHKNGRYLSFDSDSQVGNGLHVDLIRKRSIEFNGVEIDENSLLDHLEDHERELIFGKSKRKREVRLMHLRRRSDASATPHTTTTKRKAATATESHWRKLSPELQRIKRSSYDSQAESNQRGAQRAQEASVQIQDEDQSFHSVAVKLQLHSTPKLIDDSFIFIGRYANTTRLIDNYHKLVEQFANCFYSNENSALDLCEDENMRGKLHHNHTDFYVHPLPKRFGNSTHVIVAASNEHLSSYRDHGESHSKAFEPSLQFEPDEEDFNERGILHKPPYQNHHRGSSQRLEDNYRHNFSSANLPTSRLRLQRYEPRYHYENHRTLKYTGELYQSRHDDHDYTSRIHRRPLRKRRRRRRFIPSGSDWSNSRELDIETAVFVDSDLFKHMAKNFPDDTEAHLFRFVLAMINGVQRLYHDPSLGHRVNFVLKRLEIIYTERHDLRRSSDIDIYLSNFCLWQRGFNPTSDNDAAHYDHAVILTGLDLYVVGKNGKVISQVVGLAPVAGMCSPTSSCTINEGKHFESVFVVAHEIGHNLGMRHDTKENSCDPSLYIMSPTLGSGKITWSKCSRNYLELFLSSEQSKCLLNRGHFARDLDHAAGGLPGERFDANKQCMLKYGKGTVQARAQLISDVCRDLHCQRDRYTWTSHPALEGTNCGDNMWCRSGVCKSKPSTPLPQATANHLHTRGKFNYDKTSLLETSKMGHLLNDYNYHKTPLWSDWSKASDCDSGCLYGPSKRLREGSTGLRTYTRRCLDHHHRMCSGSDRKYESCIAQQCYSIEITTIEDFARREVCEKARKFDSELTGKGQQIVGSAEESCKVFCNTKTNTTKSRRATFPDGTTCRSKEYHPYDTAYCISGRCERFTCENSTTNYFKIDPIFCQFRKPEFPQSPVPPEFENKRHWNDNRNQIPHHQHINYSRYTNRHGTASTTARNKYENEVVNRNQYGLPHKPKTESWNKYNYHLNDQPPLFAPTQPSPHSRASPTAGPIAPASLVRTPPPESEWIVKSGCHSSCIAKSRGIQVVASRRTGANNIQLCSHTVKPCDHLQTAIEYAENTCARYKLKVRGLSGRGTQIAASIDEPNRSCHVGCQDESIKYRYYLVNGKYGHFPLGTRCSKTEERYCVNGQCLEFGRDKIPLQESHISLALFRSKRAADLSADDVSSNRADVIHRNASESDLTEEWKRSSSKKKKRKKRQRMKRSFLYYTPVNITETITQEFINNIIDHIAELSEQIGLGEQITLDAESIDLNKPIHISNDE